MLEWANILSTEYIQSETLDLCCSCG